MPCPTSVARLAARVATPTPLPPTHTLSSTFLTDSQCHPVLCYSGECSESLCDCEAHGADEHARERSCPCQRVVSVKHFVGEHAMSHDECTLTGSEVQGRASAVPTAHVWIGPGCEQGISRCNQAIPRSVVQCRSGQEQGWRSSNGRVSSADQVVGNLLQ